MDAQQKITAAYTALEEAEPGTDQYESALADLEAGLWLLKKEAADRKGLPFE